MPPVANNTAPVAVKPPTSSLPPLGVYSAVVIFPFNVIVAPVKATSLISVPISTTLTVPPPAFKVTSVASPLAVPRI